MSTWITSEHYSDLYHHPSPTAELVLTEYGYRVVDSNDGVAPYHRIETKGNLGLILEDMGFHPDGSDFKVKIVRDFALHHENGEHYLQPRETDDIVAIRLTTENGDITALDNAWWTERSQLIEVGNTDHEDGDTVSNRLYLTPLSRTWILCVKYFDTGRVHWIELDTDEIVTFLGAENSTLSDSAPVEARVVVDLIESIMGTSSIAINTSDDIDDMAEITDQRARRFVDNAIRSIYGRIKFRFLVELI